jgi:MFS family permease
VRRAFLPTLLFVGTVVAVISSLGAPLIPTVARELHASLGSTQWMLTAPVLVAAVASPLVGRLGDGPQRKSLILGCLSLVLVGGVLAALAQSLGVLIAGRALQGLGLTIMPLTMATAREALEPAAAGRAIATLSVIAAAGVGLGYPLTGLIAQSFDAAAAFWFGAAFTAVALVAGAVAIPSARVAASGRSVDYLGALLIGSGLLALLIALEKGAGWGWGSTDTLVLLVVAAVVLSAWVWWELRFREPLVDLRLLRHPGVLTANVAGLMIGIAMYMSIVVISQIVQLDGFGFGASVFVSGLTLVPLSVTSLLASRTLPAIEARLGARAILPAGSIAIAVAVVFFAVTTSSLWQAFMTMAILGLGVGYTFAAMPGLIVVAVPRTETSSAMAFYQVSRYVGFSIGSGLAATLLHELSASGEPTLGSYRGTALVAGVLGLSAALVTWLLPARVPAIVEPDRALEEGALGAAGLPMLEDEGPRTVSARVLDQ